MVGDQPHDALAVLGGEVLAGIAQPAGQAIDPQSAVGIEHDLDNGRVFQPARDGGAERRAQHARAA
jgi:hypothetical protein